MEIYDYYNLAAQQQNRNLAKNMIIKLEIYMTGTEESIKKNKSERGSRIRSQRDSFKRSTKIIQISSGKMRKTKQQRGKVGERERGSNPITTQQEATTNELIMLQVKAKKRSRSR